MGKHIGLLWSLIAAILLHGSSGMALPNKGILVKAIDPMYDIWRSETGPNSRERIGRTGQQVTFEEDRQDGETVAVEIDGQIVQSVRRERVIPLDPDFTVSRVYLLLMSRRGTHCDPQDSPYILAKEVLKIYPTNPLREEIEFLALDYCKDMEDARSGKYYRETIDEIERFLSDYPDTKHRDEAEWMLLKLRNYVYEYEGSGELAVEQFNAYTEYLKAHPSTSKRDEINYEMARFCRIIVIFWPNTVHRPDLPNLGSAGAYANVSKDIYRELLKSQDVVMREQARVALYNMEHGRSCYGSPPDW